MPKLIKISLSQRTHQHYDHTRAFRRQGIAHTIQVHSAAVYCDGQLVGLGLAETAEEAVEAAVQDGRATLKNARFARRRAAKLNEAFLADQPIKPRTWDTSTEAGMDALLRAVAGHG